MERAATADALSRYHESTKHSPASVAAKARPLDWSIKPLPFKIYTALDGIAPPNDLGRLFRFSNGVLRRRRSSSGESYGFRAAPCTGALYHIELYLATAARPDLAAGVYHYGAHDNRLRQLRQGDMRDVLLRTSGDFAALAQAPLVVMLTSTFWRNAWKYRERAYRHTFWDSGVILANLLALVAASGETASLVMGFVDDEVNRLVGADGLREAAVALVAIGTGAPAPPPAPPIEALDFATAPLSPREARYPAIEDVHRASSLASPDEVAAWREDAAAVGLGVPTAIVGPPIEDVIRRRRSTRTLSYSPISRAELDRAITAAMSPIPGDVFGAELIAPFLVLNAVEGVSRGAYDNNLSPIRLGDYRRAAGQLALGQELGASAAVDVYFLADLDAVFARFGERGYRAAQMAGGIAGGRMELAATAMGLGATGLTFFDDEVTRFFEPAAAGRQVMYLEAIGQRG